MIFMTQKQFEQTMDRAMYEQKERERMYRLIENLDRQICELREQLHILRMKTDPDYQRQNTPTCGEAQTTMP